MGKATNRDGSAWGKGNNQRATEKEPFELAGVDRFKLVRMTMRVSELSGETKNFRKISLHHIEIGRIQRKEGENWGNLPKEKTTLQ